MWGAAKVNVSRRRTKQHDRGTYTDPDSYALETDTTVHQRSQNVAISVYRHPKGRHSCQKVIKQKRRKQGLLMAEFEQFRGLALYVLMLFIFGGIGKQTFRFLNTSAACRSLNAGRWSSSLVMGCCLEFLL